MRKQETCFFDHRNFVKIYEHYATILDYDKAEKVVRVALTQHPFSTFFYIKKAQLRLLTEDFVGAARAIAKAKMARPIVLKVEIAIIEFNGAVDRIAHVPASIPPFGGVRLARDGRGHKQSGERRRTLQF